MDVTGASTLTGNTNMAGSLTSSGVNTFYGATSIGGALTATSTLNVTGQTVFSSNVGIGTSSPYAKLSVVGEAVASYFTATSTTATSTFTNLITTGTLNGSYTTTIAILGSTISSVPTGAIIYVKTESASVNQINITSKTNLIIDGQGATLTLNNGTNEAIFYISGGSRITIRNFNFVGPNTGTYNATNKHRGIVVTDDASWVLVENSAFTGFDSQGIYVENVGGTFDAAGTIISNCIFKNFLYDSATDLQAGILLGADGEYTTIKGNFFTDIPSAIRSTTGNVTIINNVITRTNAASETGAPSATKGVIYATYNTNSGKYIIADNMINHNAYNVIPLQLYGESASPQNSFIVTNNSILLNTSSSGSYQQIRATDVDNSVFSNNIIRAPEGTATDAVVEIIDSDNVQIIGNHIMNGTYGIKATANSSKTTSLNLSNNIIRDYATADIVTSGSGIAAISPKFQKQFIGQTLDILHSTSTTDVKLLFSPISGDTGTDYSSYAHTATVTGYTGANVFQDGMGYSITGGSGKYYSFADADEFSFNGTTDTAFSTGGFFNLAVENNFILIAKEDALDAAPEWSLYINSSNKLIFLLVDKSASTAKIAQISTAGYTTGKHCIVGTYNGSASTGGIKLYVDGLSFASGAYSSGSYVAMENLGTAVTINAFSDGTWNRTGTTTQAFIVGRELQAEDVRAYCLAGGVLGY